MAWAPDAQALAVPKFGPAYAVANAYLAGGCVEHEFENEEGRYLHRASLHVAGMLLLKLDNPADARADYRADTVLVDLVHVQTRIFHGHVGSGDGIKCKGVQVVLASRLSAIHFVGSKSLTSPAT